MSQRSSEHSPDKPHLRSTVGSNKPVSLIGKMQTQGGDHGRGVVSRLESQLRKAEFINSQLLLSQKKKEEMIAVLVEENKALKENLNKCEAQLDLRRRETKIYRGLLQKVGIIKRGQHPRNEEDAKIIFNSFLQVVQEEDMRFKRALKRGRVLGETISESPTKLERRTLDRGASRSKKDVQLGDPRNTINGQLSSADFFRSEVIRPELKKRELAKLKRRDFASEPIQQMRVPPVYEQMHRKNKRESTLFPDQKGRASILNLTESKIQDLFENGKIAQLLKRFSNPDHFFDGILCSSGTAGTSEELALQDLCDTGITICGDLKMALKLCLRLKRLTQAVLELPTYLSQFAAMEAIVRCSKSNLQCDRATVFLLDQFKGELWSKAASGSQETIRIPMGSGIVGAVVTKGGSQGVGGQSLVENIEDAYQDTRFSKRVDIETGYRTKTILAVPIFNQRSGAVMGACQAINKREGTFSPDDQALFQTIARAAGLFLQNASSAQIEVNSLSRYKAVMSVTPMIHGPLQIGGLIMLAERALMEVFNIDEAVAYYIDHKSRKLVRIKSRNPPSVLTFPLNAGLAGECARTGNLLNVADCYNHPLYNGKVDINTSMPLIVLPILTPHQPKIDDTPSNGKPTKVLAVCQFIYKRGLYGRSACKRANLELFVQELITLFQTQLSLAFQNALRAHRLNESSPHRVVYEDEGDYDISRLFIEY